MKENPAAPETIDEAVKQIQHEFPRDSLAAIECLSVNELKSYRSVLDEHIYSLLISWLHNNTTILEQCGGYSVEEIVGYVIWELWTALRAETDNKTDGNADTISKTDYHLVSY